MSNCHRILRVMLYGVKMNRMNVNLVEESHHVSRL